MRLKKNDLVIVIAGKEKGKTGKILKVLAEKNDVIVEQLNIVKRHQKPSKDMPTGGISDKEAPIHVSNVMLLDPKTNKPTRIAISKSKDGAKVRVSVKSKTIID